MVFAWSRIIIVIIVIIFYDDIISIRVVLARHRPNSIRLKALHMSEMYAIRRRNSNAIGDHKTMDGSVGLLDAARGNFIVIEKYRPR